MNGYKKIIKSPKVRKAILNSLSFIPDVPMLKMQYRIKLGRNLDLKNPVRYTEKLQWYKINYRNPLMRQCVDKYRVREYVKSKGLENILISLIKKYNTIEDINWEDLPQQFVMKTTNGGGGLNVLVCNDKSKVNWDETKDRFLASSEVTKKNSGGREWAYYGLKRHIVVEELLINEENPEAGINDYKIFCYYGVPKYIIADVDRYIGHKRNFYDANWNNLHITSDCPSADREIQKPENFEKMLQIAGKLSEDFPYVRVDLYNIGGKIYFGELTFYPWSGYVQFTPDEADYLFGEDFELAEFERGAERYRIIVCPDNYCVATDLEVAA